MIVKPLITIYCDGKRHDPADGEFTVRQELAESFWKLAEQGAVEIIEDKPVEVKAHAKSKRGD